MAERTLTRVDESVLQSPDLQVVLCGTGSPIADAGSRGGLHRGDRGRTLLPGRRRAPAPRNVVDLANLPLDHLQGVLLTHFHSDHIGDLGEVTTRSWIAGRAQPLDVYGPPGVARVVAGVPEMYAADVDARVAASRRSVHAARGGRRRRARDPARRSGRRRRGDLRSGRPARDDVPRRPRSGAARRSATASTTRAARSSSRATPRRART